MRDKRIRDWVCVSGVPFICLIRERLELDVMVVEIQPLHHPLESWSQGDHILPLV